MDIEFYVIGLIALIALVAGYTQSVTGFGFGIVAMIFLPSLLLYTEANVLSTALSTVTSLVLLSATYKHVNWKNIVFPLVGSTVANYFAISYVKGAKNDTLILLLGIALFALSIYFFFFSGKIKIKPTWYAGLIAGVISGISGGLFSIGGPPVVIYYMQSEKTTEKYLGTISAYFVASGLISVGMKAASGFVSENVLFGMLFGLAGMAIGAILGRLTRNRTNPRLIRKIVYGFMAVSGIINIVTSII